MLAIAHEPNKLLFALIGQLVKKLQRARAPVKSADLEMLISKVTNGVAVSRRIEFQKHLSVHLGHKVHLLLESVHHL